jgi:hypothetical protein
MVEAETRLFIVAGLVSDWYYHTPDLENQVRKFRTCLLHMRTFF